MANKTEKYQYGGKPAEVQPAVGVKGTLIRSFDGSFTFRVYHNDGEFTDYDIRHDDLEITIVEDELVAFYKIGKHYILDHSPEVLGLEKYQSQKNSDARE